MKGLWLLVAVVAGAAVGMGVARWRLAPAGSSTAPSPTNPGRVFCPQVVVTCNDGYVASTPCGCQGHGGVKSRGALLGMA